MVADWSDDKVWALTRGGHDPRKVYAAYKAAVEHTGQPTVILAKTVKGYGMGEAGEGMMIAHQAKKMGEGPLRQFRDRFAIPVSDADLPNLPFVKFEEGSAELAYLRKRRQELSGPLPARRAKTSVQLELPPLSTFGAQLKGSEGREVSTTMAFVQMFTKLMRDKGVGQRIVPIVPDESRTFGMEGMFRQFGIFSQVGQLYKPEDSEQLMFYKESKSGQVLEEGINEAGAMSSWIAAATSYSASTEPMNPFYIYYSMFGFQSIGDLAWAAGDMRARGFLIGGTSGRTTLNGEGLQHEDGHSHLISATVPNCISYDPTFGYELAVIIHDGMRRMYGDQEDVYYYITTVERELPSSADAGRRRGWHHQGHVPAARGQTRWPQGAVDGLRGDPARSDGGCRPSRKGLGDLSRHLERDQFHRAASRSPRCRTLEHAASRGADAGVICHAVPARPGRRSRHRVDGLHEAVRRPDPRLRAPAPTVFWAPTASAVRTTGRRCARSSRSTGITWRWLHSKPWRMKTRSRAKRSLRPSRNTAST